MPPRRDKSDAPAPRKRALVSCDRCKLRRARCIRDNAEEPCSDCRISGVHCESKLPRKQRVYGSVETLSVRYRALESIVKGLFPQENVQDTSVLFTLAAARNIPMPAADDYTPANIFHENTQIPLPAGQARLEHPQQPTQQTPQQTSSPQAIQQQSIRSGSTTSSLTSTSKTSQHNPFSEVQPSSNRAEDLIPTRYGVPHYFGPSSSFRLATTIRALSARCKDLQGTHAPRLTHSDSSYSESASRAPTMLRPTSTNPSDEEYTISDKRASQPSKRKRSGPEVERTHQRERFDGDNGSNTIEDLLPSRSLADACVQAYFDHVHIFLPLFHRSMFQYQMEATYSRQSELLGECKDMGWLICLALVFAFGCEQLHEHDPDQAQALRSKYLDFTKTYFRKLLTTNSIANVQALMLLNLHHHSLGQKSTSWLLIGLGARMAITMGMHRDGSNREFDPIERNTRRQVWWSIYVHEKILCSVLGRPTVIDDREMTIRLPDASMLEQRSMSSEFLGHTLEISQMSYRIRQRAYFDARTAEERSPTVHVAASLLRECDEFYSRMPPCLLLDFSSRPPAHQRANILLLHLYYYYTRCIVSREFLIQKVERDISLLENRLPPISEDWDTTFALGENCVESAHQSIRCIMAGLDLGLIGYSWLDLFFIFHSVLIVCADFLARPVTQQDSQKDSERKEMVRAMLDHVRGMKKLAPTYSILGRIAMQFAGLTGVYHEREGSEGMSNQAHESPTSVVGHDYVQSNSARIDFEEDWFARATTNLGLDFCDLSQTPSAPPMPGHHGDTIYPVNIQPIVSQVEDWTTRSLRGI